jgi:hypothetical protein
VESTRVGVNARHSAFGRFLGFGMGDPRREKTSNAFIPRKSDFD